MFLASEAAPKRQLNYKVRGGKQEVTKGEVPAEVVNGTVTSSPVGVVKPEKGTEKETGVQSPAGVVQPPAVSPLPPTVVTPGGTPPVNGTKGEDEDESSEEEEEDEDEEGDDDIDEKKRGAFDPSYKHMNFFIPGYVTSEGEVLVPIDTITKDYSIVSDPIQDFRRNPYTQYRNKVSRNEIRNVVPAPVPESPEADSGSSEEEPIKVKGFSPKEKETVKIVPVEKKPEVESVEVQSFEVEDGSSEEGEKIVKIEGEKKVFRPPPLALVPATKPTDEDDEEELRSRWLWRNRYRFFH